MRSAFLVLFAGGAAATLAAQAKPTYEVFAVQYATIPQFAVSGLVVTSVIPLSNGFTVTFNKPFIPADLTLFGANQNAVADVVKKAGIKATREIRWSVIGRSGLLVGS